MEERKDTDMIKALSGIVLIFPTSWLIQEGNYAIASMIGLLAIFLCIFGQTDRIVDEIEKSRKR